MMTSTTLTTAPIAKSVQKVPKKVRRVPINRVGVRDFFFARRSFRFPKQSVSGSDSEAIDRICVYIIDIVFVWVSLSLSPSLGKRNASATVGVVVSASTDQKTRAAAAFARAREREREREREQQYLYSLL